MSKIVIIDAELQTLNGHNFQASWRSAQSARAEGHDAVIYANRHFDPSAVPGGAEDVAVIPFFPALAFDFPGLDGDRLPGPLPLDPLPEFRLERLADLLAQVLDREALGPEDTVYIHTLSKDMLSALLLVMKLRPAPRLPRVFGLIYADVNLFQGRGFGGVGLTELLRAFDAAGLLGRHLFLHVETRNLQRHFAAQGFDFPVMMGPIHVERAARRTEGSGILFIGDAREEKGFYLVPEIVAALLEELLEDLGARRIWVQVSSSAPDRPGTVEAIARLRALAAQDDRLTLLDAMGQDEYESILRQGTVFVLPYDRDRYRNRGSGIAYEALMQGAQIVCTEGIDVDATFADTGQVVACAPTVAGFVAAIRDAEARPRWPEAEVQAYMARYAVGAFFGSLKEVHGPVGQVPEQPCVTLAVQAPLAGASALPARSLLAVLAQLPVRVQVQVLPAEGQVQLNEAARLDSWVFLARHPELFPKASLSWVDARRDIIAPLETALRDEPRHVIGLGAQALALPAVAWQPGALMRREAQPTVTLAMGLRAAAWLQAQHPEVACHALLTDAALPGAPETTPHPLADASLSASQQAWIAAQSTAALQAAREVASGLAGWLCPDTGRAETLGKRLGLTSDPAVLPPLALPSRQPRSAGFAALDSPGQASLLAQLLLGDGQADGVALTWSTDAPPDMARDLLDRLPQVTLHVTGTGAEQLRTALPEAMLPRVLVQSDAGRAALRLVDVSDSDGLMQALSGDLPLVLHDLSQRADGAEGLPVARSMDALVDDLRSLLGSAAARGARLSLQRACLASDADLRAQAEVLGAALGLPGPTARDRPPVVETVLQADTAPEPLDQILETVCRPLPPGKVAFGDDTPFPSGQLGWSVKEARHRWMQDHAGFVVFRPDADVHGLRLDLRLFPEAAALDPMARVGVLGWGSVPRRLWTGVDSFTLAFAPPLPAGERVVLWLTSASAVRPAHDSRALSISCSGLELLGQDDLPERIAATLRRATPEQAVEAALSGELPAPAIAVHPVLAPLVQEVPADAGQLGFAPGDTGALLPDRRQGWSIAEPGHRWIEGPQGWLVLRPEATVSALSLTLKLLPEVAEVAPRVRVDISGHGSEMLEVSDQLSTHRIALDPPLPAGQPFVLRLVAERSMRPSYDGRSLSIDCAGIALAFASTPGEAPQ